MVMNGAVHPPVQLTQEMYGGEVYEYYPLGKYIVAAPGVCGGRPTFKYTRLEVSMILAQLSIGRSAEELSECVKKSETRKREKLPSKKTKAGTAV